MKKENNLWWLAILMFFAVATSSFVSYDAGYGQSSHDWAQKAAIKCGVAPDCKSECINAFDEISRLNNKLATLPAPTSPDGSYVFSVSYGSTHPIVANMMCGGQLPPAYRGGAIITVNSSGCFVAGD